MITTKDRLELRLVELFLQRRADKPDEPLIHAYAEIYGDVIYEARMDVGHEKKRNTR